MPLHPAPLRWRLNDGNYSQDKRSRNCWRHVVFVAVALSASPAWAQDQAARSLAANCTSCHGPGGRSSGAIPTIAGFDKAYFLEAMQGFKGGTRQATVMHQHAKGYTDPEIETLAEYFSREKRQ